jgi:hypothetical protein
MSKKFIVISTIITLFLLILSGYAYYRGYAQEQKIIKYNKEFVEAWGTYDYKGLKDYPLKVKKYLSDSYYADQFGDEESNAIYYGRLYTKEYSISTVITNNESIKKVGDDYSVKTLVKESVSSAVEKYTKDKYIVVVWENINSKLFVKDIEYSEK